MSAVQLNYTAQGLEDPLAPTVLLIHGLFGSSSNWRSIAGAITTIGMNAEPNELPCRRVVSVDLRNHGASPWSEDCRFEAMAEDLAALIDRLGGKPVRVVGHSLGGKAAMALALLFPSKIDQLIVVDIAPVKYAHSQTPVVQAMISLPLSELRSRVHAQELLAPQLADPRIAPFLLQNLVQRDGQWMWRINLASLAAAMDSISDFPPTLRSLVFPTTTHVISGQKSDYVELDAEGQFNPMFPVIDHHVVPNAGHWVHADQPKVFIELLQSLLNL